MRYRHVFFDLDGTLTDSAEGITNSVMYALAQQGVHVSDRQSLYRFIGPPLKDSFEQFYSFIPAQTQQAITDYRTYFSTKGIYENRLMNHCVEMLTALKQAGCHLYICTSKPDTFTEIILRYFHIDGYFDGVYAATMDGKRCTKPEILQLGLASIAEKADCVMIGDRRHDIEGAIANGIDSIGVLCGFGDEQELTQAGATHILHDLSEVAELICRTPSNRQ